MSCKICGRGSCTTSFHSLEEQEFFDKYSSMDERQLMNEIQYMQSEIKELQQRISELEIKNEEMSDTIYSLSC
jgi:TolA-binding protein